MLFHKQCPKCIAYIHDTLAHPLPSSHPLDGCISYKHLPRVQYELATGMEQIVKDYFGHKNLVLRMIREHRSQVGPNVPLHYEKLYSSILQWYSYLYADLKNKTKRKHPFQMDMEYLAVLSVEAGVIRGKNKNPLSVFHDWFFEYYLHFLEHLDEIHTEHDNTFVILKAKKQDVETKWDRSNLDNLYD